MEFVQAVNRYQKILREQCEKKTTHYISRKNVPEIDTISWSWVASSLAVLLEEYSLGITDAMILCELELKWERYYFDTLRRARYNFSSIESLYEDDLITEIALHVTVEVSKYIPECDTWVINVIDGVGEATLDVYLNPKFNAWAGFHISLNSESIPFLQDRTLRMLCSGKFNRLGDIQQNTIALERNQCIAHTLSTENMMFQLEEEEGAFVREHFPHTVRHLLLSQASFQEQSFSLWLKVVEIESTVHAIPGALHDSSVDYHSTRTTYKNVYLVDTTHDTTPIVMCFFDEHIPLTTLFKSGDYIGVYHPSLQHEHLNDTQRSYGEVVLDYCHTTVLFFMEEACAEIAGVHKPPPVTDEITVAPTHRNSQGDMDCTWDVERTTIDKLVHSMLNVTLFGRIALIGKNTPFVDGSDNIMDRYTMRIVDETGRVDVTLWEEVGRSTRKWREKDYVLLSNLSTTACHESDKGPQWYMNGSEAYETKGFNVTHIKSMLTSSVFRHVRLFQDIGKEDHWQMEMTIVGWELHLRDTQEAVVWDEYTERYREPKRVEEEEKAYDPFGFSTRTIGNAIITDVHDACLHPVSRTENQTKTRDQEQEQEQEAAVIKGRLMCVHCECVIPPSQVVQAFQSRQDTSEDNDPWRGWIAWRLDDGSGQTLLASGCEETILNIPAYRFKSMSHKIQTTSLDSVMGKSFYCSLTRMSPAYHRIDQAAMFRKNAFDGALIV
ncbi:hypothetical protein BDF14DRAFT_1754064 [Spinellus fusiger]|nr:hypothetical protein BDF14DRAFT_1754064 [Spinellus fusiger]